MSWVCPYQSHLQPGKGSLSVSVTNSSFFQEWWFGAMGSCLLLPKNDDLCEQQLLIHGQGHAVPKSYVMSTVLEGFSLYAMIYFIKMLFRWCLKQPNQPPSWLGPLMSVEHRDNDMVLWGMKLQTNDGHAGWAGAKEWLTGMMCHGKRAGIA